MKYWSRYPVFRFLIPFSSGILWNRYYGIFPDTFYIALAISILLSYFFTNRNWATGRFSHRWLAGIPFYAVFFFLGVLNDRHHDPVNNQTPLTHARLAMVRILESPQKIHSGWRLVAAITSQHDSSGWQSGRGNVLIVLKDNDTETTLKQGDHLIIATVFHRISNSTNPGSFDYAAWMATKGIYHRCYLEENHLRLLKHIPPSGLLHFAVSLREFLLEQLKRYVTSPRESAVAAALLLGYDDWLDPEMENQYKVSGTLHILCVSGMHVGLIYMIISWLIGIMIKKIRWLKPIRDPLIIALIWLYAMVTGLAPSAMRAATMLTFVIGGQMLSKPANIYNTLCASCLFLFSLNPQLITHPGFLLSFLAVCGIVIIQKPLQYLWHPTNTILHHAWSLITVSLAAQLATTPLSIYFFHQFPNYFLLGNLFVVPITPIIMYSGIALFVSGWLPFAGMVTGKILEWTIRLMNFLVDFFASLPGALTEGIFITLAEMILLYLLLLLILKWLMAKHFYFFTFSLFTLVIFLGFRISHQFHSHNTSLLTVYDQSGKSLISLISGHNALLFADSNFTEKDFKFTAGGHFTERLVYDHKLVKIGENSGYKIGPGNILIMKSPQFPKTVHLPDSSLVIIGTRSFPDGIKPLLKYHPRKVIFDSSCPKNKVRKWASELRENGISVHAVGLEGAAVINLCDEIKEPITERPLSFLRRVLIAVPNNTR